jgi:sporulation protein YlmC with PRC-barrel domain
MGELDIDTALEWRGRKVIDRNGEEIGTLAEIYLDEDERPHWGSIRTGLFGTRETLVPLTDARREGDVLRLPYDQDRVTEAPNLDPDVQLSADEEQQLYRHYGVGSDDDDDDDDEVGAVAAKPDRQRSEQAPGEAAAPDDAMTRSEEEVQIRKRPRERGRARLKKYVVTDYVEKKVPVQREEVRVEYEPPEGGD